MEATIIQIVSFQMVALMAILGFLWRLHRDISNVRQDVAEVKIDMANLRQEMKVDMAHLRREIGEDMAGLRQDFGQETASLRERMCRMEGLLEGFVARPAEAPA
ncbi:MAG: hypothetical protein OXC38_04195 [Gammaproteobacteria bacterium]|nr:hypothetical protein [Gammaproteobacteria bacterium]